MTTPPRSPFAPGASALASAARALDAVTAAGGCTAEQALLRMAVLPADASAVRAIHSGTLRWYLRLAPMVDLLLQPGQTMSPQLRALLTCAVHQLEYSRAVPAAAVNIAVDAARVLELGSASGFVNALLRRFLRERAAIVARVDRSDAAALAHPRWLLRALRSEYPAGAADIIRANNEAPAMTLRVNLARTTTAAVQQMLAAQGMVAHAGLHPSTLVLEQACEVEAVPGFSAGLVSVQDAGAQTAALWLDAKPGERVLDACAAPGGKTGHILEHTPDIAELIALDVDGERLQRVQSNLTRLQLHARLVQADLQRDDWWDGMPFHRILLDAPCTGTGVIRRHPDIKLLRRPDDAARFAQLQARLLARCAPLLAPGGQLVYVTCSVLPEENGAVIERFLLGHREFNRTREDLQLLPTPLARGAATLTDGFYYACLRKGEPA
jgi:16S rRNA (cytosine967-C5)-methyltransferase